MPKRKAAVPISIETLLVANLEAARERRLFHGGYGVSFTYEALGGKLDALIDAVVWLLRREVEAEE